LHLVSLRHAEDAAAVRDQIAKASWLTATASRWVAGASTVSS
jgi:hypothetical protein